jgi:hypothetical protein
MRRLLAGHPRQAVDLARMFGKKGERSQGEQEQTGSCARRRHQSAAHERPGG